jgi:hypothetical protein
MSAAAEALPASVRRTDEEHERNLAVLAKRKRERLAAAIGPAPLIQRADELLRRQFAPIRWAILDLLPEGVSLLVGAPKVGKSWLALQFAIAITDGSPVWTGRAPEVAGDVLLLGLEDNDRRMQSRIAKLREAQTETDARARTTRAPDVSRLHFATEWPRMDKGGLEHLDEWLAAHPACRLVIIDTLARFRPPESGSANAYASDYAVGAALKPISDRHNVALLLLHHTRKMASSDVLDTVSGTQGLTGSVDALLMLRRERGQFDAALYVTGRDIEHEEDHALQFHGETCTWSSVGNVHEAQLTRERREIVEFLRVNGPSQPKEIAEALGKNRTTTRRLLQKLFADGHVRGDGGRYDVPLIQDSMNRVNTVNSMTSGNSMNGPGVPVGHAGHDVHGVHAVHAPNDPASTEAAEL